MEEKKYYIDESKIAGDKVCEPSPAYRSAATASSASSASDVSEPMMAYSSLHHAEMEKKGMNGMRFIIPIPILWAARWSR